MRSDDRPLLGDRGLGYDAGFLPILVPLPAARTTVDATVLPFTHFSVVLDRRRRLAVATGANVDGAQLVEIDRGDDWHLDDRIPTIQQCGPEIYADNDLDRGHLVRRRDPVWGPREVAAQANMDTFAYVNAAPQAALFNQGELLWLGLEDYILGHARTYAQRLSVFTAPILDPDDPPYRGIQIPRRFWKVVAWTTTPQEPGEQQRLAATGYLLDQTPQLDLIDLTATGQAPQAGPPPLGEYLTYQVPIVDLVDLTGLDLGPLPAADRLAPVPAANSTPWRPLKDLGNISL